MGLLLLWFCRFHGKPARAPLLQRPLTLSVQCTLYIVVYDRLADSYSPSPLPSNISTISRHRCWQYSRWAMPSKPIVCKSLSARTGKFQIRKIQIPHWSLMCNNNQDAMNGRAKAYCNFLECLSRTMDINKDHKLWKSLNIVRIKMPCSSRIMHGNFHSSLAWHYPFLDDVQGLTSGLWIQYEILVVSGVRKPKHRYQRPNTSLRKCTL